MESIILFSGVGLFLIILAYGLFYLKRLRRAFDQTEIRTVTGSDAERIVKAYRTEEGYLQRRSRVWLLMIAVEAAVVLITAGGYIYAANKDRWALEAEQRRIERAERERQEALIAEAEKQKAEAEELSPKVFRYKQKKIKEAEKNARNKLAELQKAKAHIQNIKRKTIAIDQQINQNDSLEKQLTAKLALWERQKRTVEKTWETYVNDQHLTEIETEADLQAFREKMAAFDARENTLSEKIKPIRALRDSLAKVVAELRRASSSSKEEKTLQEAKAERENTLSEEKEPIRALRASVAKKCAERRRASSPSKEEKTLQEAETERESKYQEWIKAEKELSSLQNLSPEKWKEKRAEENKDGKDVAMVLAISFFFSGCFSIAMGKGAFQERKEKGIPQNEWKNNPNIRMGIFFILLSCIFIGCLIYLL